MGNTSSEQSNTENNEYDNKYDLMNKNDLINTIRGLTPDKFNYNEELVTKMTDINLHNKELIPMMVELYEKLNKLAPYKKEDNVTLQTSTKSMSFVKPKFSSKEIVSLVESSEYPVESLEKLNLFEVKKSPTFIPFDESIFSINEFESSFRLATSNKDMMGVSKKLLVMSPKFLKARYISQINKLYRGMSPINKIAFGRASYIYKTASHGKATDMSSFRQIVTIPTIVNHMHRLMATRMNKYIHDNKFINTEIQKGGVINQKYGIFEQIFKVKNALQDANKNKLSLSLMFMDISNAFGNLNLNRMLEVMEHYHLPKMLIDYVKAYYENLEFYVDTDTIKTDVIKWKKGLVQGCPLSPTLFCLTMNYILEFLNNKYKDDCGYKFHDGPTVLFTAYIDDICVMTKNTESLQIVVTALKDLLLKIGLRVNEKKCATMYVNQEFKLDGVENKKSYKYLGEIVNEDGSSVESFLMFIKEFGRKLYLLDKSKNTDENKGKIFFESILPWLQRKVMIMYDTSNSDRLKIIALVNDYLSKWKCEKELKLFTMITELLKSGSIDKDIKAMNMDDVTVNDTKVLDDIDLLKATLSENEIQFTYDSINSSDTIDDLLDKL